MSLITRAGDLVYTFRFLKMLVTKFEDTEAFKMGLIDADGKRIKSKKIQTNAEAGAYTTFHRLVFNIKKLLAKAPGGSSRLASYAAALFLLREHFAVSDKNMEKILKESGIDVTDLLAEESKWFMIGNDQLAPGVYSLRNEKCLSDTLDEMVYAKDKIRVDEDCFPIDDVFGIHIYEATHINTGQTIHFTVGEIYK